MGKSIQELAYKITVENWPSLGGSYILDVGSAHGARARRLALQGASVTILDLRPPDTPVAEVKYVRHDLNQGTLPFETEVFDIVVSTEVLEHLRAPFCILTEMVRVLKPHGMLILTMPNYWNIKYRIKYLLTGHFQRPRLGDPLAERGYHSGLAPHINSITYPTLKAILTWEGCVNFSLKTPRLFRWSQRIVYLPFLLMAYISTYTRSRQERAQYLLSETNGANVLLGRRHILIQCFKNDVDSKRESMENPKRPDRSGET